MVYYLWFYALFLNKKSSLINQKNALYFLATTSASNFRYLRNERSLLWSENFIITEAGSPFRNLLVQKDLRAVCELTSSCFFETSSRVPYLLTFCTKTSWSMPAFSHNGRRVWLKIKKSYYLGNLIFIILKRMSQT